MKKPPFKASWIDRFMDRIEGLPGPPWLFYAIAFLLFSIVNNAFLWLNASLPVGEFSLAYSIASFYVVFFIALQHFLNHTAARAIERFKPIYAGSDAQFAADKYSLTHLPFRWGWAALAWGLFFSLAELLGNPGSYDLGPQSTPFFIAFIFISFTFSSVTLMALLFHAFRQLSMVMKLNRRAENINLFRPDPAYAFSDLTARMGDGLILISLFIIFENSEQGALILAFVVAVTFLGVAAFVLPLLGMQSRLKKEKLRLISAANHRLEQVIARVHDQVDSGKFSQADELNKTMSSLIAEGELLARISTWPWDTATLRGFASTVMLPILLWGVTRILENYF